MVNSKKNYLLIGQMRRFLSFDFPKMMSSSILAPVRVYITANAIKLRRQEPTAHTMTEKKHIMSFAAGTLLYQESLTVARQYFDHLFTLISSPRFLQKQGLNNEVPFSIYPYSPDEAVAMERVVRQLVRKLEQNGCVKANLRV
jgi:hypothetical protein